MFDGAFQPMHWLVLLAIAVLLFGPKKLPELGKGLGESIRGFRQAMKGEDDAGSSKAAPETKDPTQ
jgi:sec-independent protein translocase protein TatA